MAKSTNFSIRPADWKLSDLIYPALAVSSLAYLYLIYKDAFCWSDGDHARLFLISLTIAIPEIVIWFIAARGAKGIKEYAQLIKGSKDGKSLNYFANALMLIVLYVVIMTAANSFVAGFKGTNYLKLV